MFTKSLVYAAVLALNANALKLKSGVSTKLKAGALAGVNIRALSKAELKALLLETADEFVEYEQNYSKSYLTEEENEARQTQWLDNKATADTHNEDPNSSCQTGENKFSDQSEQEKALVTGTEETSEDLLAQVDQEEDNSEAQSLAQTNQRWNITINTTNTCAEQSEFQWGDDVISPIKDQMQCGSCYTFGAVAVLEGAYAIKYGEQFSFAEQKMVDCKNDENYMFGCNGGSQVGALLWAKENTVPQDTHYPYVGNEEGVCHDVSSEETQHVMASSVFLVTGNALSVKKKLCQGPLTAVISTPSNLFSYTGGVMNRYDCPPDQTETLHSVNLIGWTTVDGVEAVVVRNSWGTGWGQDGYAYFELSDNDDLGVCGMYREIVGASIV